MGYFDDDTESDDPRDDKSFFREVLSTVFKPINFALDVLGTPAGIVRDTLAGKGLADIGRDIFDPSKRATGRDVITNLFGQTNENDRATVFGVDAPSIAVELITDPLLYTGSILGKTSVGKNAARITQLAQDEASLGSRLSSLYGDKGMLGISAAERQLVESSDAFNLIKSHLDSTIMTKTDLISQGFGPLQESVAEQAAAGQRGLSFQIPFAESTQVVPTSINKMLSPLMEGGDFVTSKLKSMIPFQDLFRSSPLTQEGEISKKLNRGVEQATIIDAGRQLDDLRSQVETWKGDPKDYLDATTKFVEDFGVPDKAHAYTLDATQKLNSKLDQDIKKLKISQVYDLTQAEAAGADSEKITKINSNYEAQQTKLVNKHLGAVTELTSKYDQVMSRVQKNYGFINQLGEIPEEIGTTLVQANADYLSLEKSVNAAVTDLNDPYVNYLRRIATPEAKVALEKARDSQLGSELERNSAGLTLDQAEEHYLSTLREKGIIAPEGEVVGGLGESRPSSLPSFEGDFFVKDPILATQARRLESAQRVMNATNWTAALNLTLEKGGEVPLAEYLEHSPLSGWMTPDQQKLTWTVGDRASIDKAIAGSGFELEHGVPMGVLTDLQKVEQFKTGGLEGALKLFDNVNNVWRSWLTAVPAYAGTKVAGDVWANAFAGTLNPVTYFEAGKELARRLGQTESPVLQKIFGSIPASVDEMGFNKIANYVNEIKDTHLLNSGMERELEAELRQTVERDQNKVVKALTDNPIINSSRGVNKFLDDVSRVTHYIEKREAGFSTLEAQRSVEKYLFDYSELSPFERNVMKRSILFYTFMRKNVPFSLQEVFINRRAYGIGALTHDTQRQDQYVPEYIGEQGNLRFGPNDYIDTKNPLFEANKLNPQGGGLTRVFDKAMNLVSPLIKIPLELGTGREFFRGKPLNEVNRISGAFEGFPGTQSFSTNEGPETHLNPILNELRNNLFISRVGQSVGDILDPNIKFLPSFLGFRTRELDPARTKQQIILNELEQQFNENPAIRKYGDYFSIEKPTSEDVKRKLQQYETTRKTYR